MASNNYNATAHEVFIGAVTPNLAATNPILELQPLPLANTPAATGSLVPPQSPSGSVTNQASTWEYTNSEMAVQYYTTNLTKAGDDGVVLPNPQPNVVAGSAPYGAVVGNKIDSQTLPVAPTGSYVMQGTNAISNLLSITASFAGIPAAQIAVFNFGSSLGNI